MNTLVILVSRYDANEMSYVSYNLYIHKEIVSILSPCAFRAIKIFDDSPRGKERITRKREKGQK